MENHILDPVTSYDEPCRISNQHELQVLHCHHLLQYKDMSQKLILRMHGAKLCNMGRWLHDFWTGVPYNPQQRTYP